MNFDELIAQGFSVDEGGSPSGASAMGFDDLLAQGFSVDEGTSLRNEVLSVGNRAVEGAADIFSLFEGANRNLNILQPGGPQLFGLNVNPINEQFANRNIGSDAIKAAEAIALYGPEKADTRAGRILGEIAYQAPAALIPGGSVSSRVGGALGAGLSTGVVKEVSDSPVAAGLAGIVGGGIGGLATQIPSTVGATGRAIAKGLFGESDDAIRRQAGETLRNTTGLTADDIRAALGAAPQDDLGRLMTTAEVTGNAPLAQAEKILSRTGSAAQEYADRAATRSLVRDRMIDEMSSVPAVNKEALGSDLIGAALETEAGIGKEAAEAWAKMPRDIVIPTASQKGALLDVLQQRQGGLKLDRRVESLVDQFVSPKKPLTSGALQDIRSDVLDIGRTGNLTGFEGRVLGALRSQIDDAMEKGLPEEALSAWQSGRELTRTQKELFGRGTAGGTLTNESARPSNILANVFKGDDRAVKELRAAISAKPELIEDFKRGVLDAIPRDVQGNLTAARFGKFLDSNQSGLKELFPQEHFGALKRISDDLKSEAKVAQTAFTSSKGNSITAQAQTVAKTLENSLLGRVTPSWLSAPISVLKSLIQGQDLKSAAKVQDLLFKAAMNPQFAVDIAASPTPQNVLGVVQSMTKAIQESAVGAARAAAVNSPGLGGDVQQSRSPTPELRYESSGPSNLLSYSNADSSRTADKLSASQLSIVPDRLSSGNRATSPGATQALTRAIEMLVSPAQAQAPTSDTRTVRAAFERLGQVPESQNMDTKQLDPLVQAVIWQESRGKKNAVSPVGAKGLMQLMDATGKEWFQKLGLEGKYDPFDQEQNVAIGSAYLKWLREQFGGDIELALAAYNGGIGRVQRLLKSTGGTSFADIASKLPKETREYVPSILNRLQKITVEV